MAIKGAKISGVRKRLRELVDAKSFIDLWELIITGNHTDPVFNSSFIDLCERSYDDIKAEVECHLLKFDRLEVLFRYIRHSKNLFNAELQKKNKNLLSVAEKTTDFIDNLEGLYKVYTDIRQEEMKIDLDKPSYTSTVKAPLRFFRYLLNEDGINDLRKSFLKDEYEGEKDLVIDSDNDLKIYNNFVDGLFETSTKKFITELDEIVKVEVLKLLDILQNNIDALIDKREKEHYLQGISIELKKLFLEGNTIAKERYVEKVRMRLNHVVVTLLKDFDDYLSRSRKYLLAIDQNKFNKLQVKNRRQSYALNYIGNDSNDFIKQTFGFLKNKYIPAESYDLFLNAFNGQTAQNNLLKIRWLQRQAGSPNKYKLIHFFKSLVKKGLIEEDDTSLKYKLPIIFSDFNGNPINNIQNSFSQFPAEYKMDPAMNEFLAAL